LTRLDNLKKSAFDIKNFNAYLIFNNANMFYFLGFQGPSALLIPDEGEPIVYTYGVNYEQTKVSTKQMKVELIKRNENMLSKITSHIRQTRIKKLAVDKIDADVWIALRKLVPEGCSIELNNDIIEFLRIRKDPEEICLMRKAGELTIKGMEAAYEVIRSGAKEFEVAAEIEYAMRKRGAGPTAFETIVASGTCSAFPHGDCSRKEIREGDLVIVDIGATYKNYCSDMTRTLVAGKPTEKQSRIYKIVHAAQINAIEKIRQGVSIGDLDKEARVTIDNAGYGEYFVHRLGHGVGLEIHESPTIGPDTLERLVSGSVFTVEPGIYLPGYGGVRIEDTVLVKADNCEKLTSGLYDLTQD
jgi:Xaa-Pro aminopeptidase